MERQLSLWIIVSLATSIAGFPGIASAQCLPPTGLTAYLSPDSVHVWLHFTAPNAGQYMVWSTTNQSVPGGFPENWLIEDTVAADSALQQIAWTDPVLPLLYKRYVTTQRCGADHSPPSNMVGYVKLHITEGSAQVATPLGLPFKFWYVPSGNIPVYGTESRKPSSIIGAQTRCGTLSLADRIARQDNGQYAYRNSTNNCNWSGSLETNPANMEPGRAYWYQNLPWGDHDIILAGEADTTAIGVPTVQVAAPTFSVQATPYSWRYPCCIARNQLDLIDQGFVCGSISSSDRVLAQQGGASFYLVCNPPYVFGGSLLSVCPGKAYWIMNRHAGHTWNYTFNASGVLLRAPEDSLPK